jgi:3-hydroxybutyryl-CoA dehydratase
MGMQDIQIGQSASLSKSFSSEDVVCFSSLSRDTNELHLNEEYAKTTIFHQRIVHGFLGGSLISAVIGTLLPGKGAIYLHQDMDFKKPIYHGELITAVVTVVDAKYEKGIYYLRTECINQEGEVKITGNAVVKY